MQASNVWPTLGRTCQLPLLSFNRLGFGSCAPLGCKQQHPKASRHPCLRAPTIAPGDGWFPRGKGSVSCRDPDARGGPGRRRRSARASRGRPRGPAPAAPAPPGLGPVLAKRPSRAGVATRRRGSALCLDVEFDGVAVGILHAEGRALAPSVAKGREPLARHLAAGRFQRLAARPDAEGDVVQPGARPWGERCPPRGPVRGRDRGGGPPWRGRRCGRSCPGRSPGGPGRPGRSARRPPGPARRARRGRARGPSPGIRD